MFVEQQQRVVADRFEALVIRAPFLRPVHGTPARIHVEHDPVGPRRLLGLREQLPVDGHQPDEMLLVGEQLVSNQCNVEVSATPRSQIFGDPISRNVGSAASRSASLRSS